MWYYSRGLLMQFILPLLFPKHFRLLTSASFSSSTSTQGSLSELLQQAYLNRETDGIFDLIRQTPDFFLRSSPQSLLSACVQSSTTESSGILRNNQFTGILNALIASSPTPEIAVELLRGFDTVAETQQQQQQQQHGKMILTPNVVTLSCAYSVSREEWILQRAIQLAKKQSGSKRRRAVAASKRRKQPSNDDVASTLRELFGMEILHDDQHYLVVNKPSGMVCHHKRNTVSGKLSLKRLKTTTTKSLDVSLEDAVSTVTNVPLSTLNFEGRGIVHRLDRGASGCIILAKTEEGHADLLTEFFSRRVKKSYLALVPPLYLEEEDDDDSGEKEEGFIDVKVGGRSARSKYRIQQTFFDNQTKALATLLKMETETGRKHQVRIHCAEGLGRPIFLDPLYFQNKDFVVPNSIRAVEDTRDRKEGYRFFLHAEKLSVPKFGIEVKAPLPDWWTEAVENLK